MPRYKCFDRSQSLFLTVCLDERLLPGAFEFTLDYLIDRMDLASSTTIGKTSSTVPSCEAPMF
jgi:hypothetical protein